MKIKNRIILVCFLVPALLSGQKYTFHLEWDDNDSIPSFSGAFYPGDQPVPHFFAALEWKNHNMLPSGSVTVHTSSPLPASHAELLKERSFADTPELQTTLVYEKKRPVLHIIVNPLFREPETGQIFRIERFTATVSHESPMARLKSLSAGTFASQSELATGEWFRIGVSRSGIHRLTYEQLLEIGLENPASVRIYGTGGILLPEDYSKGSCDDLSPVPVFLDKGSDQVFGPGDHLLFYAKGTVSWHYDQEDRFWVQSIHPYATEGTYFITDDRGAAISPENGDLAAGPPAYTVTRYDLREYHEEENFNLLKSGKKWYSDRFSINLTSAYPITLDGISLSDSVFVKMVAAARSNEESVFSIRANNTLLGEMEIGTVNLSSYTSTYAKERDMTFGFRTSQELVTFQVTYDRPNDNSIGWLDHISVNARGVLDLRGDELLFRDSRSAGFGNVSEFRIQGAAQGVVIWDVTDPGNPLNIPYSLNGSTATFTVETNEIREFAMFRPDGDFPSPVYAADGAGRVENQDLHGTAAPDMVLVYPELFREEATRLADHRRQNDQLDVLMVTQEEVYNEFSSGTPNIAALRNFLKMYYDRGTPGEMPRYLLLFGDGSYDNRDTTSANPNLILTYQSDNSLSPTNSYVSDDFYGLLDTGESLTTGLLDIGIGRLPVSTREEAALMVDKIIAYDQSSTIGEWRNYISFIGDDEDNNIHMKQANSLAEFVEANYPGYNVGRIFMDAYPQETSSTGDRYPGVTRAINERMQRGALIINYTGHGGVTGLAHEKILEISNIKSWNNEGKWPLFMTATCEFSRYDEYNHLERVEVTSAGEEVLLNPEGGSIALFTTTRLVYSAPNHELNEEFYNIVFERDENDECYRLGDIIAFSKNEASPGINKRNFTLLGDPSIRLSYPKNVVVTDSINSVPATLFSDTISALEFVTVSGHVQDQQGRLLENFNGSVVPIVYDKKNNLVTLANDGGSPWEFQVRNSILYKGNATVSNGRFSFSFYIPKDINFVTGTGKISYYASNGETDAHGAEESILIGGIGDQFASDTTGPSIMVYMNDSLFRNGGIVDPFPELLVYINDQFGINTTGNGIGHDITATLNDDRYNAIILNEFYQADMDSYNSGTIRYPYSDLPTGKHRVVVKVWDIYNNSAQAALDFVVVESARMLLDEVYTYPNPFIDQTWFNIEHNRPDSQMEVVIRIYDLNGRLAAVIREDLYSPGYRLDPVPWDGRGAGGATLGGGLYVYKVVIRTSEGEEAVGSGRLIIKR